MYLFPQGLYCEYFMYRKDIFEKAGIKDTPTTWNEFEEDCQKIANTGEIPVITGGSDAWQLMRYLSFSPWRVTGPDFITNYQAGKDTFADNKSAKYAVNLLYDLGTKGYFEPGFASVDFTSACNLFFGGTGAIFYSGSGQIGLAEEMYDKGDLGFFPVPDTDEMDNMSTNVPVHAGFAEAFNKATYDSTMQGFFDYMCENFSDACYTQAKIFSPFNENLPEGLPQLYYDTQPMFENAQVAWTSWDDKLDSDVLTQIVDAQQQLAQGSITPDEFIAKADSLVKK
jgi:raffinose/stachyose/melibiose transport system substrate-binding protein